MSYSNATFYINTATGSDAARTALTTCIASNPSGTITRINKNTHGLSTGAVVDLTLFSAWLNDAWKITVVDANNFDLDGAVWQVTADNNGTVTPRGGSSWSDAWLSITGGPTATRVQGDDTIRVSKSPDPFSIGNATWTNTSNLVTLASAQTVTIDNCETAWTVANTSTVTASATRKQGSFSVAVSRPAGYVVSTLYAYKSLGSTINYSAYDAITLWIAAAGTATVANNFKVCLCSDVAGAVIVDEFILPASVSAGTRWFPVRLTRTGGGALGSSIQSIALYTHTTLPAANTVISLDNISACSSTGLSLTSLVSKTSAASGGSEGWWCIQSLDGTSILLDIADTGTSTPASTTRGYTGATETVATYARETTRTGPHVGATTNVQTVLVSGLPDAYISFSMGWNTSTNLQDGETIFDGVNGTGNCLISGNRSYINIDRFSACRYVTPLGQTAQSTQTNWTLSGTFLCCCGSIAGAQFLRSTFSNYVIHSITGGSNYLGRDGGLKIVNCSFVSNTSTPMTIGSTISNNTYQTILYNCLFENNATSDIVAAGLNYPILLTSSSLKSTTNIGVNSRFLILKDCSLSGTVEFSTVTANTNNRVYSQNHDLTAYEFGVTDGGTFNTEATDRPGQTGKMWRLVLTNTTRNSSYPLELQVGQFACNANSLVTVTAWMKKSHATNCRGKLRIRAYQLRGINSDVITTLSDNTNWQQVTLTFTPLEAGVFEVEALAEYVSGNANVYIDTIEVTQA